MATKPKAKKYVETWSGRSGSSAALNSPINKKALSEKGGIAFDSGGKWVNSEKAGKPKPSKLADEKVTVRSADKSKKTYVTKGKFAKGSPKKGK